ncbi:MAG: hypothetical protein COA41_15575, partial [Sphingopyxis sp.]
MTSKMQHMTGKSGSRQSGKLRWLSGGSLAAAAFLLVSAPQTAHAQQLPRAPGMIAENTPHGRNVSIPRPEIAHNQPHHRSADFNPRDVRISAPLNPLPVNDVRISAPVDLMVENIRISAPVTLSGANQPQRPAGMAAINEPQATGPRISASQAFQASGSSASAITTISRGSNADIVTVFGPETFINWTPLDTANGDDLINILPGGTTLNFVGPNAGYTVLNRILPTGTTTSGDPRGIAFSGNVASRLGDIDGSIGGNIWFYSPGGIVVGAGSTFDVGSLVLTTNDIDTTGGLFGAGGEIRFSGTAGSRSSVTIENDATINALNDRSSYVAMVAPRVVQGGTVNVDGSAAYVAAEQAELTINNGLFDIAIGVGTADGNGVVHSGTTTGPSSTPTFSGIDITDADAQAIYMVAVPKNDALTMLVGGNLGYEPAASASIVNGNVVLSAGANVATTGDQTNASFAIDKNAADSDSNIQLQNVSFGSSVSTFATNGLSATASSLTDRIVSDNSVGSQDLLLEARNQLDINTTGGGSIDINGDLTLRAGTDGVGGTININADQVGVGTPITSGLLVAGDLVVDASAQGLDDFFTVRNNGGTGIGQDAVGGNININISGDGDLVVGGTARFDASAQGGKGENQNGFGQGGNINLTLSSGTFNIIGQTVFDAQVIDADESKLEGNGPGLIGSNSVGGNVNLLISGGALTTGNIFVNLDSVASAGAQSGGAQSNDATSGSFDLRMTGGSHVINDLSILGAADASTSSFDAAGMVTSGLAESGTASFLIDNSSLTINSDLNISLGSFGVSPESTADRVSLTVQNGASLTVGGFLDVETSAYNGVEASASTSGSISILVDNATITIDGMFLDSSARPNDQFSFFSIDEGRDFQGGDISLIAQNSGTFTSGFASISANATGNDTNAGDGTGGDILINANNGSINFTSSVSIDASGIGGVGGSKDDPASLGAGRGGAITLRVQGAGGALSFTDLGIDSDGSISVGGEGGAPPFAGDGGFGFGGNVTFDVLGGTLTANDIDVGSDGSGGGGGDLVPTAPLSSVSAQAAPADLTVVNAPFAGGVSVGDGGDGQGGDVTFNLNGGNATVNNLTISANGFGGDAANGNINDGTAGGTGGRGIGGNTTFNAQAGTLTVTSTLTVSADGNNQNIAPYGSRGSGGFGYGSDGGAGGAGIGGTATFNLDGTATINADQVIVSTSATGGYGGSTTYAGYGQGSTIQAGIAGDGGDATGGNAAFNNNAGTLNFNQLSVNSIGTGGDGGEVFGFSTFEADNDGGNGGIGTGGNAAININQDDLNNPVYVVNASGVGGDGGEGVNGGNGGAAFGGIAAININGTTAVLDDPSIIATATGGAGGQGKLASGTFNAGDSGNGGDATGGTARLQVTGAGGNIDLSFITLQSDGFGGQGASGYSGFSGDAGSGGDGGNATGGRSELVARTGGTINLAVSTFDFTSTGTGGAGGDGGYSYANTTGDGGDGGFGVGGTSLFLAQGGTITGQDVNFTTAGIGGDGGVGGTYGYGSTNGLTGTGGTGTGGTVTIEVQEGSPGIITLNDVVGAANGTSGAGGSVSVGTGGRIEITDSSIDPAGLITLNSLTATAFDSGSGSITLSGSTPLGGLYVTGNSDAIAIAGDLTVNVAGNIEYNFDGNGKMLVGGNAVLNSGQNILIGHSNNATPVNSIDVAGTFNASAQGNFIASAASILNAGSTMNIRAEQNASVNDARAVTNLELSAGQNATLNNATVTGAPLTSAITFGTRIDSGVTVLAGFSPTPTPTPYDPNFNAAVTGTVTSTGFVNISAGGNATFDAAANVLSDNGIRVRTGDDIIVAAGAVLQAAVNPADSADLLSPFLTENNLILDAGGLQFNLNSTPLTPIASIVAAGTLNANSFAVDLTANAIDGLGGTVIASSVSADVRNSPSDAAITASGQSDDNGLLSAQCVGGNVCLGILRTDNIVRIGRASTPDVIQAIIEGGTIAADDILVTTRRDIIMGTDGIATVLDAANRFLVESTQGNVDLRNATASSASIQVSAVNGSLLGSGSLISANDIGITVGQDINATAINAGGQLTTIANLGGGFETSYTVPGSINVGTLTQGGATNINIIAGGDISFGRINLPANQSITLTAATGNAFLGSNSSATSISVLGNNVGFNDLLSTGTITLNAAAGNLTGSGPGNLSANGVINLDAANDISFGNGTSPLAFTADAGGAINFGNATGRDIQFTAATNINGTNAISPNATGGLADRVILNAGGNVSITNSVRAIDIIDIDGVNVSIGTLDSGDGDILATGAVTVGNIAGTNHAIQGTSIDLTSVAITGSLTANATTGSITSGNISASTANLTAADAIALTDVTVTGPLLANAGGAASFGTLTGRDIQINAGGNITGTSAISPNPTGGLADRVILNAGGNVSITNTVRAIDIIDIDGVNVSIGTLDSGDGDILATGAVTVGSIAGTTYAIQGTSIDLTSVALIGAFTASATTGSIASGNISASTTNLTAADAIALTDVTVTGPLLADAGGEASFGTLTGRDIQITAGGNITGTSAISPNATGGLADSVSVNAAGNVTLTGTVQALDIVDIDGVNVSIGTMNSDSGNVLATAAADVGTLLGGTHVIQGTSVNLDNSDIGGNLAASATAGDITVSGNLVVGGAIDFDATGAIGFGRATGSSINMDANGNIAGGDLTATNALSLNGGTIAIGDASAANIAFTSGANILFNALTSPNAIALTAANGMIGKNTGAGDIISGGDVDLTAQAFSVGDV